MRICGDSMQINIQRCLHIYLCLMGYTDQSGIRLWQHLTLAVRCCMSCVVPIRINYINNTHFCDSAVLSFQEKKKAGLQNRSLYSSQFYLSYVNHLVHMCLNLIGCWLRNLGYHTHC